MSNRIIQPKGYTQLYTGNGKGKTTAALGLAFRAMGCGMKTYIGQFMKGQKYNELNAARMFPEYIVIEQYGKDTFVHVQNPPDPENVEMAKSGYKEMKTAMLSGNYNIIIADEIITSHYGIFGSGRCARYFPRVARGPHGPGPPIHSGGL